MVKQFPLLLILLITGACGNDVNISNKKLEYNSSLSDGSKAESSGTLIRGTPDRLTVGTKSYKVSIYSSYNALEFIAAKPLSTTMPVLYKGKANDQGDEMVLEIIQAK
jgi:hypothetical protein